MDVLEAFGAEMEVVTVPGALEIPGSDRHGRQRGDEVTTAMWR